MVEEWRDVEGFDGKYQVSNLGRVRSTRHKSVIRNKVLSPQRNPNGYLKIYLGDGNGGGKQMLIHRLVAIAFIPNPENLEMVNHKDEDVTNNCVSNLEWCSRSYNQIYSMNLHKERRKVFGNNFRDKKTGENTSSFVKKGVPHSCFRRVRQTAKDGSFTREFENASEAGAITGIPSGAILGTCRRMEKPTVRKKRRSSAYGYYWEFAN